MGAPRKVMIRFAQSRVDALVRFLSKATKSLGVAEHVYIVGGAVRNWLMGIPPKDVDIVVDTIRAKKDSEWLAKALQRAIPVATNLTTNQYDVAILTVKGEWGLDGHDMKGETIEIATARKESYGGAEGKGYKPHMVEPATIREDLLRREFTFNTLLWRLADLHEGPHGAPVLDLLGCGRSDLEARVLRTPGNDPNKTFSDDPTRMLRAVKFMARYDFEMTASVFNAIRDNGPKLHDMPWNAVQEILVRDILHGPKPRRSLKVLRDLGLDHVLRDLLHRESGFASGLGRSLNEVRDVQLLLDIHALWDLRSPISFLDTSQRMVLQRLLNEWTEGDFFEGFVRHLVRPPIDQSALFEALGLEGRDRARVLQNARQALLDRPELAQDPSGLEAVVRDSLGV